MTINLRRIFNVFHIRLVSLFIFLLALVVALLIVSDDTKNYYCLIAIPVLVGIRTFSFSDYLTIEGKTIKYKNLNRKSLKISNVMREDEVEVTDMSLRQNFIEKIFNAGHVRFVTDAGKKITIYGIMNFKSQKQEMENQFNSSKNQFKQQ